MRTSRRSVLIFPAAALAACVSEAPSARAAQSSVSDGVRVDVLATGLNNPWGLAFLPDGAALITEKHGGVRRFADGALSAPLSGGPANVRQAGQSGLQDIALDPRFAENGFVYISFFERHTEGTRLALWRARYEGGALRDGRVIYRAGLRGGTNHPGGRMAFLPDETLLMAVGLPDNLRAEAQNLRAVIGKIVRIDREGRPPADNPFIGRPDAAPEIYSYGHRNPMGLIYDAESQTIWSHENGPRGGDELNIIRPGANYGWPLVTYGVDYSGAIISERQTAPGVETPVTQWTPSLAPSGLALYRGEAFQNWRGDLLIGFLAGSQMQRLRVRDGRVTEQEDLLLDLGARIRDVRVGPGGFVFVLTDGEDGALMRLSPA